MPRCRTCPVLLAAQARSAVPLHAPASLFDEIYRPTRSSLPAQVAEVLVGLSYARQRYRLEHAAARRSPRAPTVVPLPPLQTP